MIRLISPEDVAIQKSPKSKILVVHVDKLKLCHGPTPPAWSGSQVQVGTGAGAGTATQGNPGARAGGYRTATHDTIAVDDTCDPDSVPLRRGTRSRRSPERLTCGVGHLVTEETVNVSVCLHGSVNDRV